MSKTETASCEFRVGMMIGCHQNKIVSETYFNLSRASLVKSSLSEVRQLPTNESPLETMKNGFYFMLIALSVLEIFYQFLS